MQGAKVHSNGRDVEDVSVSFDETGGFVSGDDISYETPDREAALNHGIPESVLDAYETSGYYEEGGDYGQSLFDWFMDNQ